MEWTVPFLMAITAISLMGSWFVCRISIKMMNEGKMIADQWRDYYHKANQNEIKTFELNCQLLKDIKTLESRIQELERLEIPPPLPKDC